MLQRVFKTKKDSFFYNEGDLQCYVIPKGADFVYNEGEDNKFYVLRKGEVLAYVKGETNKYHPMPKKLAIKMGFPFHKAIL